MPNRAYYATKKNPNAIFINQQWLNEHGPSPYYLDQPGETYILKTNVSTPGTAFVIIKDNITFDLGGNTITFNDSEPIIVPNGSFEEGTGSLADGWDFTNAPHATRYAGVYIQNTLFDGTYSLRFNGHTGTEEIISEATVTLEPNVTYSLSAVLSQRGYASGLSLRVYVKLVGQDNPNVHTIEKTGGNNRGMSYTDAPFTTGPTSETYKIVIGSDNPTGRSQYEGVIDFVKVQRHKCHGIVSGVTTKRLEAGEYPGVTRTGTPVTVSIKNGIVIQGADNSSGARGIWCYSNKSPEIGYMHVTTGGANGSPAEGLNSDTCHVHNSTFLSNVRNLKSRDSFHASVLRAFGGSIHDNNILGGVHTGIWCSASRCQIYNNTVKTSSWHTNGFGIVVNADQGSEIYNNLVDLSEDDCSGRGMMIDRVNDNFPEIKTLVHDNIIIARELPRNQEYGGAQAGGCYGIQLEQTWHTHVYNNDVTVYADEVQAHALRMNNYTKRDEETNIETPVAFHCKIYGNTFTAIRRSTDPYPKSNNEADFAAFAAKLHSLNEDNDIEIRDNTFISNFGWLGELNGNRDQVLLQNKFIALDVVDPTKFYPLQGRNYPGDAANMAWRASRDIRIVDPIFDDSTSENLLKTRPYSNMLNLNVPEADSWFFISNDVPFDFGVDDAGKTVEVKLLPTNEVIFTGVLDAEGKITIRLDAMKMQGGTKTSYAYSVDVVA